MTLIRSAMKANINGDDVVSFFNFILFILYKYNYLFDFI